MSIKASALPDALRELIERLSKGYRVEQVVRGLTDRYNDIGGFGQDGALFRRLLAIGMIPSTRSLFETELDVNHFNKTPKTNDPYLNTVIIGGGLHAAIYAAVMYERTGKRATVFESGRPGGSFAVSKGPSFYLNSRNRPGPLSAPGERGALNALPKAFLQPSMLSACQYQRNDDMAFSIRIALAAYADVYKVKADSVSSVEGMAPYQARVTLDNGSYYYAKQVFDARGMGIPVMPTGYNPNDPLWARVISYPQLMTRMGEQLFPLTGMRRVAVVGDGDSGKTAIEALMGLGPAQHYSVPEYDRIERLDWYAPGQPTTCQDYVRNARARYRGIGALLPRNLGSDPQAPVRVIQQAAYGIYGGCDEAYVGDKRYDLVVHCTGSILPALAEDFDEDEDARFVVIAGRQVASNRGGTNCLTAIGPAANLGFDRENDQAIPENRTAIWRLAPKTAALAAAMAT